MKTKKRPPSSDSHKLILKLEDGIGPAQLKKALRAAGLGTPAFLEGPLAGKTSARSGSRTTYVDTGIPEKEVNGWDLAHLAARAAGSNAFYVEPDRVHEFVVDRKVHAGFDSLNSKSFGSGKEDDSFDKDWMPNKNIVWHLDDNHSQLQSARTAVADSDYKVCIGHLDTGYSGNHPLIPSRIKRHPLQRNFVTGEPETSARDPMTGGMKNQPGHGTGTLGLLAGSAIEAEAESGKFKAELGGAPFAEVICCRISPSVILLRTHAFASALQYLSSLSLGGKQVHVVSMSMGGAPSQAWVDAVNQAYEAGIILVTAAGNNINGFPTRNLVFPARFERVIAACGATYDFQPYYSSHPGEMQGCYGPRRFMSYALAAYTPNTPWASVENGSLRYSGAGTSSATPQIAAAAAIYYRKYNKLLDQMQPWQRIEAVRGALYATARKQVTVTNPPDAEPYQFYFGNGILRAADALQVVPSAANLKKAPETRLPWFPILDTLFALKTVHAASLDMLNTELNQLVFDYAELGRLLGSEETSYEEIQPSAWADFRDAILAHRSASQALKKALSSH